MSRYQDLGKILKKLEGRKYKPDYMPTKEDIDKIHKILTEDQELFVKLGYIACKQDILVDVSCPAALYMDGPKLPIISDVAMHTTLKQIKEKNLDFAGTVYYTADVHPAEFMQKEQPSLRKSVPDGVKMPDLALIIDKEGQYIMFKGKELYDNLGVTGS